MFNIDKLKKAKEGDLRSIEEVCADTWEPLYKYIYFKVQNQEEAEDITQEAYVKALTYQQKKGIKPHNYIAFLKTIALNILRDRWRARQRQGTNINIDKINPGDMASKDPTEETTQRMILINALDKLNEDQRKVVELRIIKGYSVAETSLQMDKKEATVRVIQYRALQNLAKILEKND